MFRDVLEYSTFHVCPLFGKLCKFGIFCVSTCSFGRDHSELDNSGKDLFENFPVEFCHQATAKLFKKALKFKKNNTPVVYLFVLLTKNNIKIYSVCKAIVPVIKPFVLRRFRCPRCGL